MYENLKMLLFHFEFSIDKISLQIELKG